MCVQLMYRNVYLPTHWLTYVLTRVFTCRQNVPRYVLKHVMTNFPSGTRLVR